MRTTIWTRIAFQLVLLFGVPMLLTFASDWLAAQGFFGDRPCADPRGCGFHRDEVDWGARHYWYYWMCFFLWLLALARVLVTVATEVEAYDEAKRQELNNKTA